MILVVGMTPAWQQIVLLDGLRLGEVNRAQTVHWCASGKGINVAIALHRLGMAHTLISPNGGLQASSMAAEAAAEGVHAHWLTTSQGRVCTTLLESNPVRTTELVENMPPLSPETVGAFWETLDQLAPQAELLVLTGSLPSGLDDGFYGEILSRTGKPAVLDIRGSALMRCLAYRPHLVKPNREELEQTVRRPLFSETELLAAMRELNAAGAGWVVVSSGGGTLLASHAMSSWRITPPRVTVVNPIGCGDCLTAGLAAAVSENLQRNEDRLSPLQLARAVAIASDNATQLLPARIDLARVARLQAQVQVEQLH